MKLQKVFTVFFLQLALIISPLFSQTGGDDEVVAEDANQTTARAAGIITSVEVSGLKRTKQQVTDKALQKYIGQEAAEVNLNDVRASIMELGILEAEEVELKAGENGAVLAVAVSEKVSLLPLPFFMTNSEGKIMAGIIIMDMNAFGINDKLYAGGLYFTGGATAMAMYAHNTRGKYLSGWSLNGNYSRSETELTDQGQGYYTGSSGHFKTRLTHRYSSDSAGARFTLSWTLPGQFAATTSLGFDDKMLRKSNNDFEPPEKSGMGITLSPALSYAKSEFDGYLMSRQTASLRYSFSAGINYDNIHQLNLRGAFEKPLVPGFKAVLQAAGLISPHTTLLFADTPQIAPILPGGFSVFHYAGASAGFEKYIFKIKYGTLSFLANYQLIETKGPDFGWQLDHGVSTGIIFYLSRIAIPALNINMNYNVRRNYFSFSFSLGMGMGMGS
jgi:hypothetical protein